MKNNVLNNWSINYFLYKFVFYKFFCTVIMYQIHFSKPFKVLLVLLTDEHFIYRLMILFRNVSSQLWIPKICSLTLKCNIFTPLHCLEQIYYSVSKGKSVSVHFRSNCAVYLYLKTGFLKHSQVNSNCLIWHSIYLCSIIYNFYHIFFWFPQRKEQDLWQRMMLFGFSQWA